MLSNHPSRLLTINIGGVCEFELQMLRDFHTAERLDGEFGLITLYLAQLYGSEYNLYRLSLATLCQL